MIRPFLSLSRQAGLLMLAAAAPLILAAHRYAAFWDSSDAAFASQALAAAGDKPCLRPAAEKLSRCEASTNRRRSLRWSMGTIFLLCLKMARD
ncbi:hypothetical protein OL229_08040 [Neisseriaceae bacterium JH1-16]|nr:hypothetical protein [Neisseriaceae bacterium JH1-16]